MVKDLALEPDCLGPYDPVRPGHFLSGGFILPTGEMVTRGLVPTSKGCHERLSAHGKW